MLKSELLDMLYDELSEAELSQNKNVDGLQIAIKILEDVKEDILNDD